MSSWKTLKDFEPYDRRLSHHHLLLALILAGYLLGALRTTLTAPLHRGPDESQHLQYVRYLAEGHGLPVMRWPPETNIASQESAQPPVYYALVATLTFWSDRAPVVKWGASVLDGLLGAVYRRGWTHPLDAAFFGAPRSLWPQASVVSGYAARLPSLLFGLLALVILFAVLRRLTDDPWSALAATAWLGWNTNYTFVHAFITPDALIALLAATTLGLMLTALRRGLQGREPVGLGGLLGLLVLTKLNGLALVAATGLALVAMPRPRSERLRAAVNVGLVLFLVAGWWFVRNWVLYGEPTGLRMMAAIEGAKGGLSPQPLTPLRVAELLRRGYRTFASPPLRLFDVLAILGFGGALLGLAVPRWRRRVAFLVATTALGIAPFILWANAFTYGWHARLFLPVWPALAALWAIGFTVLVPRRTRPFATWLLLVILGYPLVLRSLTAQPRPAGNAYYYLPVVSPRDRLDPVEPPIARFGDALLLRGVKTAWDRESCAETGPCPLHVTFFWEVIGGIPDRDTAFFVHVLTPDGIRIAQVDTFQEVDTPPLVAWPVGRLVVHLNRLLIPAEQGQQPLTLYFGVYNKRTGARWPVWITGEPQPRDRLELPVAVP